MVAFFVRVEERRGRGGQGGKSGREVEHEMWLVLRKERQPGRSVRRETRVRPKRGKKKGGYEGKRSTGRKGMHQERGEVRKGGATHTGGACLG